MKGRWFLWLMILNQMNLMFIIGCFKIKLRLGWYVVRKLNYSNGFILQFLRKVNMSLFTLMEDLSMWKNLMKKK